MEEGPSLMRHVALSLLTLVGWPLSFALLMSTTLLTVWITEIRRTGKGALEHSLVDLLGSLHRQNASREAVPFIRSFFLLSFVVGSRLVRSPARWSGLKSGMPLCQISSLEEMDGSLTEWSDDTASEMSFQEQQL